jgi:hypothetical protein
LERILATRLLLQFFQRTLCEFPVFVSKRVAKVQPFFYRATFFNNFFDFFSPVKKWRKRNKKTTHEAPILNDFKEYASGTAKLGILPMI